MFDKAGAEHATSIILDARVPDMAMSINPYHWSMWNFPAWISSSMLLSRVARPFNKLTHLHLRITAQSDIMLMIETVLNLNPHLIDVVIEADTPLEMDFYTQPVLRLAKTTSPGQVYAKMRRFVLRAPGLVVSAVNSGPFLRRIKSCTTVCFAIRNVDTGTTSPIRDWPRRLLASLINLERMEISLADDALLRTSTNEDLPICIIPNLIHLVLDLCDVNAYLLRHIRAPRLRHLRIRSIHAIGLHGRCDPGSFPSLLCVTIHCPGPVMERFRTVGLARRQFIHNIANCLWYEDDYNSEVLCYVKRFQLGFLERYKSGYPGYATST
ncbi:hypothetical protein A4X06_0g8477 [Tilletia controversa]|uniref:Uncharacterized protein n=3 Tax=Tilletia TaxID=13289 RepID=A0A8X7MJZ0_9BASI|nr:hypothetical protein CF335_g7931 [Tilletia laevis]KAE8237941.1 hypothetical protein A4X03_0g8999 [Tilletia caries]KAE8239160.1 hypothetical protein A4X06_0g8477 [Tilletia controversa]